MQKGRKCISISSPTFAIPLDMLRALSANLSLPTCRLDVVRDLHPPAMLSCPPSLMLSEASPGRLAKSWTLTFKPSNFFTYTTDMQNGYPKIAVCLEDVFDKSFPKSSFQGLIYCTLNVRHQPDVYSVYKAIVGGSLHKANVYGSLSGLHCLLPVCDALWHMMTRFHK